MHIHVNDESLEIENLHPHFNTAELKEMGSQPNEIIFQLSRKEFYDRFKLTFDSFREEMKEEPVDEQEQSDYPELYAYERFGHPSLDFLFIDHPDLFAKICMYINNDILLNLSNTSNENPHYYINALKSVGMTPEGVIIVRANAYKPKIKSS